MHLHGSPHKRFMDSSAGRKVMQRTRNDLYVSASRQLAIKLPIDFPIELDLFFVNPSSPDLDHLIEAVYILIDGDKGSLDGPSILKDDRLVQALKAAKYYNQPKTKRESEREE